MDKSSDQRSPRVSAVIQISIYAALAAIATIVVQRILFGTASLAVTFAAVLLTVGAASWLKKTK